MIRIKGQKDYLVALESVAMTDIVLNMFIFFFISFSLLYTFSPTRISRVDVRLPKAESALALKGSEKVVLAVTREGAFFLDDDKVDPKNLKTAVQLKTKERPAAGIILRVDGLAKFDDVAKALDVIHGLNIEKVSIAALKEE